MALPYADPTNTGQWAKDLLNELGAPATPFNVGYLEAWQTTESPSGYGYNPVGDETTANNSTNANSAGVQAYTSWLEGLQTITYNLTSLPQNANIVKDLRSGNAGYAALSTAQTQGGWSGGAESSISGPGTSTAFKYGGPQGETPNAPGVAVSSSGVTGDIVNTINPFGNFLGTKTAANAINNFVGGIPGDLAKSTFGPIASWVEKGAADVTFVGFGLLLIVVGLVVTFKGGTSINVQQAPSPPGGVRETAGDVADVAAA